MMSKSTYHKPVLLTQAIEGLNIKPDGCYVDATFGGGGHARAILERLTTGKLYAFDQDADAAGNIIDDARFEFINANFAYMKNFLQLLNVDNVDGIIADLGVSSHQIDSPGRGFSFRFDAELDLRMSKNNEISAKDIVNTFTHEKLTHIFRVYGEVSNASRIAACIVEKRESTPIETTDALRKCLEPFAPKNAVNKLNAKVFQALRIEVNKEIEALKDLLIQGEHLLKNSGRFVVISYHSLEDRLVKNFFKTGNFEGEVKTDFYGNKLSPFDMVSRKPIVAKATEVAENNRARSAKMRVAEKIIINKG